MALRVDSQGRGSWSVKEATGEVVPLYLADGSPCGFARSRIMERQRGNRRSCSVVPCRWLSVWIRKVADHGASKRQQAKLFRCTLQMALRVDSQGRGSWSVKEATGE